MKKEVVLSLRGRQSYPEQEPEVIELVTEGIMEFDGSSWRISYEESDLTGLKGTVTTFQVEPGKITLSRKGPLNSQMVFQQGAVHESLYEMEFGALMISVCAKKVSYQLTEVGGTIDLVYGIEIEQTTGGEIDYHLDITAKE